MIKVFEHSQELGISIMVTFTRIIKLEISKSGGIIQKVIISHKAFSIFGADLETEENGTKYGHSGSLLMFS